MGLAGELSYSVPRANAFHRSMQTVASSRPGAWFFAKMLAPTDRLLGRMSRARITVPESLALLPVLVLTTTGRRSGEPRHTHLVAVPFGDTLALLGTNFGQHKTPSWVLNLEAEPRALVTYHGVRRAVVARPATDVERVQILAASERAYGGYQKYQQRITGRRLRVLVLDRHSYSRMSLSARRGTARDASKIGQTLRP